MQTRNSTVISATEQKSLEQFSGESLPDFISHATRINEACQHCKCKDNITLRNSIMLGLAKREVYKACIKKGNEITLKQVIKLAYDYHAQEIQLNYIM